MVKIIVCRSCAWPNEKIRRELKRLRGAHPDELQVVRKDCLDHCKRDPVVQVGGKTLAPARPKKLRRAVEKALAEN